MTAPTPATQTQILADLCDAVDPALSADQQGQAAERAYDRDPELAFGFLVGLMTGFVEGVRVGYGQPAVENLMRQMRARIAALPPVEGL